ncbi:MAG TPA: CTP synthase [Candidatus Saccharimonadia bacterium]|nr:CTP synthase [Candidatus Saccharimonadia bacterium]
MAKGSQTKFIFVTGGVLSGLGKGITAASIGTILKARGFSVNIQKCDPYLNTDAGTMNPAEHGEVFVTKDGAETDLDLGHYERFLDEELGRSSSLMNGRIYANVLADERAGKYLGKTVQIIPHVTGEIVKRILEAGEGFDFHIVEIGGTVGDIESLAFLEGIRQLRRKVGHQNTLYVHVVYLPYLEASHEIKTKPAQNTVRDLREAGIQPDVIVARAEKPVSQNVLHKLSLFCDVDEAGIVPMQTVKTVYEVPLLLEQAGIGNYITTQLGLSNRRVKLADWQRLVDLIKHPDHRKLKIGVVAKYMENEDTYLCVFEAIKAAGWANRIQPEICWIDSEQIVDNSSLLEGYDGLVVPGGFGSRGVEGKIAAANYAIEHNIPYLGLCYGLHMAVIALARRAGLTGANTTEVDAQTPHPVIDIMADQKDITNKGGTMRLGNYPCVITKGTKTAAAYNQKEVLERHRHRYEVNNDYREQLTAAGLVIAGLSPDKRLVEIIEIAQHPYFVASQFHPEFKSRPNRPHPLFDGFIKAAGRQHEQHGTHAEAKRSIVEL